MITSNDSVKNKSILPPMIEDEILRTGLSIFDKADKESSVQIFNKDYWYGRIMEWSMKNPHFKTQMFRFVDVLPSLHSSSEIAKHLKEYFAESEGELPSIFNFGLGLSGLAPALLALPVKKNVTQMAKMFIVGETPKEALKILEKNREQNLTFTADLLGETAVSEKEAVHYQERYRELIESIHQASLKWPQQDQIDSDAYGPLPKVNVSIKVSALYSQIQSKAWEKSKEAIKDRLRPLLTLCKDRGLFVNLDMESYGLKNLTLELFKELIREPSLDKYPHFGIVIQAYLKDSADDLTELIQFARQRGTPFTVRLVKGAYWDSEVVVAQQKNWEIPVFTEKYLSDAQYEICSRLLLDATQYIRPAFGTHNVRSISHVIAYAKSKGLPQNAYEIQMLFGMADSIKKALIQMGLRVRDYAPIGELLPGMAYLVRRLLENTSNESFLRSKFVDQTDAALLLRSPYLIGESKVSQSAVKNGNGTTSANGLSSGSATNGSLHTSFDSHLDQAQLKTNLDFHFENEANLDFAITKFRDSVTSAIQKRHLKGIESVPAMIDGKERFSEATLSRPNPSQPTQILTEFTLSSKPWVQEAVQNAKQAAAILKMTSIETRAQLLDRVADQMIAERFDLIAQQILEVGKPWAEADGDVTEAIDFCRYYAQDIRRVGLPRKVGHAPGESSIYHYQPRGVAVIISPWNFPLAIMCGQVVAALVTGNAVILKPAEQSTGVAYQFAKILLNAINNFSTLPKNSFQMLPGLGEIVGAELVRHPHVDLIAFTGSKAVGLDILSAASQILPGQRSVKKAIIEMGGKNAIIIDNDADLDEAVTGVISSAFGFSGQKCSACSRAIVLADVYDRFIDRLEDAVRSLKVSSAENPEGVLGPVVDQDSFERIQKIIQVGQTQARLLVGGSTRPEGYFIEPTVFVDVQPHAEVAQVEIFGPVLAVIKAKDLSQAIEIANDTEYALTGGLYSRSPVNLDRARNEMEVGNLYLNRSITGAMVDRHPFGGFKLSGIGSKTGGPDYLLQFLEPRCVTENTLRRGFTPEMV